MGRILEGVKGFPVPPTGGGGVFLFPLVLFSSSWGLSRSPVGLSFRPPSGCVPFIPWANFHPFRLGIFRRGANMPVNARLFGLCCAFSRSVWVWLGCVTFRACGAWFVVVILSACVPRPPMEEKEPILSLFRPYFLPLFLALVPCLVLCSCPLLALFVLCSALYRKRNGLYWVVSPCVVVVGFSLTYRKDCKRCGLLAVYLNVCCGGLYPSGGWACDIVQIRSICGLGACLTMVNCRVFHGVFLLLFCNQY